MAAIHVASSRAWSRFIQNPLARGESGLGTGAPRRGSFWQRAKAAMVSGSVRSLRFPGLRLDFPLKIRPAGPGDLAAYPKIVYVIQAPGGTGDASRSDGLASEFDAKGTGPLRRPRLAGHPWCGSERFGGGACGADAPPGRGPGPFFQPSPAPQREP